MLTDTFLGRCLLWRAPSWDDFDRFPAEAAGVNSTLSLPEASRETIDPGRISVSSHGRFSAMALPNLLNETDTVALIALCGGRVVFRWRRSGSKAGELGRNLSVTKSIGWAIIGRVLDENAISPDSRIGDLLPEMADAAGQSRPNRAARTTSAFLPLATNHGHRWRSVSCQQRKWSGLLDHLVGTGK